MQILQHALHKLKTHRLCKSPTCTLAIYNTSLARVTKQSSTGRGKPYIWHQRAEVPMTFHLKLQTNTTQKKSSASFVIFTFFPEACIDEEAGGEKKKKKKLFERTIGIKFHLKASHCHLLQFIAEMYFKPYDPPRHAATPRAGLSCTIQRILP